MGLLKGINIQFVMRGYFGFEYVTDIKCKQARGTLNFCVKKILYNCRKSCVFAAIFQAKSMVPSQ